MRWWRAVAVVHLSTTLPVGTWALGTFGNGLHLVFSSICQAVPCASKWQYEFNILKHINLIRFHFTFASFHTIELMCSCAPLKKCTNTHNQKSPGDIATFAGQLGRWWTQLLWQLKQVLTEVSIMVLERLKWRRFTCVRYTADRWKVNSQIEYDRFALNSPLRGPFATQKGIGCHSWWCSQWLSAHNRPHWGLDPRTNSEQPPQLLVDRLLLLENSQCLSSVSQY